MNRCVYCQGWVIPLARRCLQCHRRQPSKLVLQAEQGEPSERVLTNVGHEEAQLGEMSQPLPASAPQRRLSRRTTLMLAGAAGAALGVGAAGRLVYLLAQIHPLVTYRGHNAQILAVAWSPDSRWMASTSGDEVQVWEALSGRLIHRFPDEQGVESVAWSPDGQYLATGSFDGTASVWQVATGHKLLTYRGHRQGPAFASSPTAGLAERVAQTRLRPVSLPPSGIDTLAWSPDGTRLLSSGFKGTTHVWEALTGKTLLRFGSVFDHYEDGAWSPDGQHLLLNTKRGIERRLATTGALEFTFAINFEGVNGPASWSPDGRWLATLSITPVDLWDAATGRHILTYSGHSEEVFRVVWSPDSRRVASAGYDLDVRVWSASTGQTEYIYRGHMNPFQLFFQGAVLPGTADTSQARSSHNPASAASLLTGVSALLPQDSGGSPHGIRALAWTPNGRYIASGASDNTVQIWQPG
jgi:WD40 repeat protein